MLFKTVPAKIKAAGPDDGLEEGQFEAIVSVFGNVDSYGDVVVKGAFEETLKSWADSGDPIPVYYSHRMDDPDFNIGEVLEAKETDKGLWVKAAVDLGDDASRVAKQSYRLMKGRRLTQFSFAYDVMDGGWVDSKSDDGRDSSYYELRRLKLYEVGPTPIGANEETELLGVKRVAEGLLLRQKVGAVLSTRNKDALIQAREAIDSVLKNAEPEEDGKTAQPTTPANEEARKGNSEEPKSLSPARLQRLLDSL